MNRIFPWFANLFLVLSISSLIYAQEPSAHELRLPAKTIVAFHLTEPYESCPVGTHLKVSVTGPIDSRKNKSGDAVEGVLVLPLTCQSRAILPAGTHVMGSFFVSGTQTNPNIYSYGIELKFVVHAKMDAEQAFTHAADLATHAETSYSKHEYDRAIQDYKQAILLMPGDSSLHIALGRALSEKHDLSGAITQYREAVRLSPDDAESYFALGGALNQQGDADGALAEYRQASKLDEANPRYHVFLGDALFKKRDFNGTLAEWQRGFQLAPEMTSAQHQAVGRMLLMRGDLDGSIQEFSRATQLAANDLQNYENLAAVFAKKGDVKAETAQYREISRRRPSDLGNHKRLAVILMSQKNFAEAKNEFRSILTLAPNNAGALAGLGAADAGLGNYEEARSELHVALSIDPHNAFAQRNLNALSESQAETQQQGQSAAPASASSDCTNWSPEFDEIRDPEKQDALRVDWNQRVQQSGQTIQQLISGMEQARNQLQAHLEEVKQSIVGTAAEPVTSFNFDFDYEETCKNNPNIGANLAAECEYVNTHDAIRGADGTIQILSCMGGLPSASADTPAAPAAPLATYTPGGNDTSSGTGTHVYTPGASSNENTNSPGVYTPGFPANSPANDTSMGMLDTGGNLKSTFVGMTSDYAAVNEQNHSSCDATVHVALLGSQLSGSGASLQFQASVQPNPNSANVPSGCFELEYTIEATQRMANGDPGPAAGQTFHTKFADASDTNNIELPVASTGSNGIDLVGWRVVGALCHRADQCVKQLPPGQCASLEDYKTNELPNQMMDLIKSYGITALNRDAAASLQSDLNQEASDITDTLFLDHLKILVDEANGLAPIFAPAGKLENLAVKLGPKPSLTARDVWKLIVEPQKQLLTVKQVVDGDYAAVVGLLPGKFFATLSLIKDVVDDVKEVHNLRTLRSELGDKVSSLQAAIDDYNSSLQATMDQVNEIQQVSHGIDMACGSGSSNNPNQ